MNLNIPTKSQFQEMANEDWSQWVQSLQENDNEESSKAFELLTYTSWVKPDYCELLEAHGISYEIPQERAFQDSGLFSNRYANYLSYSTTQIL